MGKSDYLKFGFLVFMQGISQNYYNLKISHCHRFVLVVTLRLNLILHKKHFIYLQYYVTKCHQ